MAYKITQLSMREIFPSIDHHVYWLCFDIFYIFLFCSASHVPVFEKLQDRIKIKVFNFMIQFSRILLHVDKEIFLN